MNIYIYMSSFEINVSLIYNIVPVFEITAHVKNKYNLAIIHVPQYAIQCQFRNVTYLNTGSSLSLTWRMDVESFWHNFRQNNLKCSSICRLYQLCLVSIAHKEMKINSIGGWQIRFRLCSNVALTIGLKQNAAGDALVLYCYKVS